MARSEIFFESMVRYYGTLALNGLALCRTTKEDIRTESLDYKKTASRVAAWWMDAYEGWLSALLVSGAPAVPTLFLAFPADSGAHSKSVNTQVPGTGPVRKTKIVRVEDGEPLAAATRLEVATLRDSITLYVSDLANPTPGTYQGYIYVDELPLAQVVIEVLPVALSADKREQKRRGTIVRAEKQAPAKPARAR